MHPILFSLGPIHIFSFGVFLTLAFLAGSFYVWREGKNELGDELILDTILVVLILALLGARLFYIALHFTNFNFNLLRWIHFPLYPGFSFWGGVIMGLLGVVWFTKRKKVSFWRMTDFLVLGVALGQILGQIGCFLDGCSVGRVTALPWGMTTVGFLGKRHPIALYETLIAILIFLLVSRVYRWIFSQRHQREGSAFLAFFTLLGLFSFLLEFLKEDGVYFYSLSLNQWIALAFFFGSGVIWYWRLRNLKKDIISTGLFFRKKIFSFKKNEKIIPTTDSKGEKSD